MNPLRQSIFVAAIALLLSLPFVLQTFAMPPYPSSKRVDTTEEGLARTAMRLFEYAKRENPRLRWDDCLRNLARERAMTLVNSGQFDHKDPDTGENPVWRQVASCHTIRCAGENLSKGYASARKIHDSLMSSPTHRRNIVNRAYNRLGVGCYESVCVELFAGI
jgi:uncharacterized protein YkwD